MNTKHRLSTLSADPLSLIHLFFWCDHKHCVFNNKHTFFSSSGKKIYLRLFDAENNKYRPSASENIIQQSFIKLLFEKLTWALYT